MIRTRYSKSVHSLIAEFGERIVEAAEREIELRTRAIAAELTEVALAIPAALDAHEIEKILAVSSRAPKRGLTARDSSDWLIPEANQTVDAIQPLGERPRMRRRRSAARSFAPTAALPSPEEDRRDAELARLRTLLRPAPDEPAASGLTAAESVAAASPSTDPLHLLQDEIRDQAHGLAMLPPASCTARIASWAGRIRLYEEANGNRVAAEFLLEKLRVLARAMDAGRIEALNSSWRTANWPSYIRTNESLADARPKEPEIAKEALPDPNAGSDYRDVWS